MRKRLQKPVCVHTRRAVCKSTLLYVFEFYANFKLRAKNAHRSVCLLILLNFCCFLSKCWVKSCKSTESYHWDLNRNFTTWVIEHFEYRYLYNMDERAAQYGAKSHILATDYFWRLVVYIIVWNLTLETSIYQILLVST